MTTPALDANSYPTFSFERLLDPTGTWIPLVIRMKLDLCQCKISLDDWNALPEAQRHKLQSAPIDDLEQITEFARTIKAMLAEIGREPKPLTPDKARWVTEWNQPVITPPKVADLCQRYQLALQWHSLDRFSRYVFWCLARKGDIQNFRIAYEELSCLFR